jgi:hypothetical protein
MVLVVVVVVVEIEYYRNCHYDNYFVVCIVDYCFVDCDNFHIVVVVVLLLQ